MKPQTAPKPVELAPKRLKQLEAQLHNRLPLVGGWLQRRAAKILAQAASPAALRVLAQSLATLRAPAARQTALAGLANAAGAPSIDAICQVWAAARQPDLAALIVAKCWTASRPPEARLLSALKAGRLTLVMDLNENYTGLLRQACQDKEASLARRARWAFRHLRNPAAQEAVCRLFIEANDPLAEKAARFGRYEPRDPYQKAVFLFLSGQWDRYHTLDFDRRLLRTVYEAAEAQLRARLVALIRVSGRSELLTIIAGHDFRSRLAVLAPDEIACLVQMLAEQREWPRLWDKVFELPLAASMEAVRTLAGSGWQPAHPEDQAVLVELAALLGEASEKSGQEASHYLPPAIEQARINVLKGRINSLAFSPLRPELALGLSERKVALWDFQKMEMLRRLSGFNNSIGKVAFSQQGVLVFGERGNLDRSYTTYALLDGQPTPIQPPGSAVTGIEAVAESQVLISERGQRVTLVDLAEGGRVVNSVEFPFWARDIRVAPGGHKAALLHNGATIVNLPELNEQDTALAASFPDGIWRCAAFTPDSRALIAGRMNGQMLVYDLATRQVAADRLNRHASSVQEIEILPRTSTIISASAQGLIEFTAWPNRATIGRVTHQAQRLTSLTVSKDGAFMAVGDSEAAFSLWDLRVLLIPALFDNPFIKSGPNQLAAVQLALAAVVLPAKVNTALRYIERVLRHRFRYDIEVDTLPVIRIGTYDIEIE